MLVTPPASFNRATWTGILQKMEGTWEKKKWGADPNETWGTVGTPVAAVKAARAKYAQYL